MIAVDLFLRQGYDETTVDDICTTAGISRSTFFRYFPAKEDVDLSDPRADALIAAALGCLDTALIAWTASEPPPELAALIDRAMAAIG
jgi:AcrR family transcriptional regulator